jgi:hypothetical protein
MVEEKLNMSKKIDSRFGLGDTSKLMQSEIDSINFIAMMCFTTMTSYKQTSPGASFFLEDASPIMSDVIILPRIITATNLHRVVQMFDRSIKKSISSATLGDFYSKHKQDPKKTNNYAVHGE